MKTCTCPPLAFLIRLGVWLLHLFVAFAVTYVTVLAVIAAYKIINY